MKRLTILVGLLVLLYLNTALIPGGLLVFRPFHGLVPFYRESGEEGAWQRNHPGEPEPWWLTRQGCVSIMSYEEEFAPPLFIDAYWLGYGLTVLGGIGLLGYYTYRRFHPRPPRPESQPSRMTPAPRASLPILR